jgi:folylpolyglutamate synthase/dihydropteroate synthase
MSSETITTVVKMLESLPESAQTEAAEYLRNHIAELQDQIRWDGSFKARESKLVAMASQVKREIAEGKARPMSFDEL